MAEEAVKKYESPIVYTWGFSDNMLEKMSDLRLVASGDCACACQCSCSCSCSCPDIAMFEKIASFVKS